MITPVVDICTSYEPNLEFSFKDEISLTLSLVNLLISFQRQWNKTMDANVTSIFDLSPSEKLQLVEDFWDDLASNPSDVPVPVWQLEEIERRKTCLLLNPAAELSWE